LHTKLIVLLLEGRQ